METDRTQPEFKIVSYTTLYPKAHDLTSYKYTGKSKVITWVPDNHTRYNSIQYQVAQHYRSRRVNLYQSVPCTDYTLSTGT
jgi:hypothetical protein